MDEQDGQDQKRSAHLLYSAKMLSKPAQELSHSLCPSDAVSFPFGDARVVARAQINTVYVLNESASLVWDAVAAGASEAEAAQSLARHYDISEDLASQDVHSVIANWRSAGLIGPRAVESEIRGPWVRSIKEIDRKSDVE